MVYYLLLLILLLYHILLQFIFLLSELLLQPFLNQNFLFSFILLFQLGYSSTHDTGIPFIYFYLPQKPFIFLLPSSKSLFHFFFPNRNHQSLAVLNFLDLFFYDILNLPLIIVFYVQLFIALALSIEALRVRLVR